MMTTNRDESPKERKKNDLEQAVAETLEFGEMRRQDPQKDAVRHLIPPYESRVKTEKDPILEETAKYRSIGQEVDSRYDAYLEAAKPREKKNGE